MFYRECEKGEGKARTKKFIASGIIAIIAFMGGYIYYSSVVQSSLGYFKRRKYVCVCVCVFPPPLACWWRKEHSIYGGLSLVSLDCREEMLHFVLFFTTPLQFPASSLMLHTQLKQQPWLSVERKGF